MLEMTFEVLMASKDDILWSCSDKKFRKLRSPQLPNRIAQIYHLSSRSLLITLVRDD